MVSYLYFFWLKHFKKQTLFIKEYKIDLPTNLEMITLNEQTNYRLIEISKIKDYFGSEIKN